MAMGSRRTLPTAPAGGGGGFRAHGGADVDAAGPVEGLVDERHGGGAAAAEDDGADGHAVGGFPVGIDGGALRGGRGEAGVGMRGVGAGLLPISGVQCSPRQSRHSAGGSSVMPSHQTPPSGVSATLVKMVFCASVAMALGLVLARGAGGDAEEAGLGIDGAELAVGVGLDPGDVVADGPDLPAVEAGGRDQHGEVGFAAGGGEGGGDVGLFAFAGSRRRG